MSSTKRPPPTGKRTSACRRRDCSTGANSGAGVGDRDEDGGMQMVNHSRSQLWIVEQRSAPAPRTGRTIGHHRMRGIIMMQHINIFYLVLNCTCCMRYERLIFKSTQIMVII